MTAPVDQIPAPDAPSGRPVVAVAAIARYLKIRELRNGPPA
jgi:hypothetical protein